MVLTLIVILYPLYFVVIASISNPDLTYSGEVWLWPKDVNVEAYKELLLEKRVWVGYRNTILYTVLGTFINLALTLTSAYALSRKNFKPRNAISFFILVTMFVNGGLIPTYLLVKNLGMLDKIWAMVIPNAVLVWNLIITRSYFSLNIPDELVDSAFIDGCSHFRFFFSIVLPLSTVIIVVIGLFYAINHWNGYFNALIYLNKEELFPLQLFLRSILIQHERLSMDPEVEKDMRHMADLVKYAMIVVASTPVLVLYPFLQRYFVKGVMLGAVKG